MARKRRRSRKRRPGRAFEWVASAALVLIILAFAISITARFGDREERRSVAQQAGFTEPAEPRTPSVGDRPTLDIRNGCGRTGLAWQMTRTLRRAGFDVVEYRDADRYDYPRTVVRDRSGRSGAAARVRDWLQRQYGVGELVAAPVEVPEADVVVILGTDLADTLRAREARVVAGELGR